MRTYSEWVQYFLNNGACLKLAEIMAKNEITDKRKENKMIQIVINLPKDVYEEIMIHNRENREGGKSAYYFEGLIQNGTPLPKHGHWIFDEILDKHYYCSECKSMGVDYWDYCPNCGAKMQESEEVKNDK